MRDYVIKTIKTQQPQNTQQLVKIIQQDYALSEAEIYNLLTKLEKEHEIFFKQMQPFKTATLDIQSFSHKFMWFWMTVILAAATSIAVFTIPENAYPLTYIRSLLGLIFILFLPGFALIKVLFPSKVPIKTSANNMGIVERLALSIGTSLAITPMVCLMLNYTQWGISTAPATLSLLGLTIVLAMVALIRQITDR